MSVLCLCAVQKLEENFELLNKLTTLGPVKLDAKSQAVADE